MKQKRLCKCCIFVTNFSLFSTLYVSFGGLLMSIKGEIKSLKNLEIDSRIYLLMSKI